MPQRYNEFYMRARNTSLRVGIRISTNCAITGAIFPLEMQGDGDNWTARDAKEASRDR